MRASLSGLCGRFIENRDIVKSTFPWDSSYMYPVCAAIITDKGMRADEARLKRCRDLLKEQTGIFSNFRSTAQISMVALLSVTSTPSILLSNALQVHSLLKEHFWGSSYLPVAAMLLADALPAERYEQAAARTRRIYDLMKAEHPFLTSEEDSVFAAMLALSDRPDEDLVAETEACYQLLRQEFSTRNAVQSLSHVLALGEGTAQQKCRATVDLYHTLKSAGRKYGTGYELATLGVLSMLPADMSTVAADLADVDNFLSEQKGYGFFGLDRKQRLMHAGMIVTSDYLKNDRTMSTAAIHGTISLIAAQQAATCAAIAASTAAANAANSSN